MIRLAFVLLVALLPLGAARLPCDLHPNYNQQWSCQDPAPDFPITHEMLDQWFPQYYHVIEGNRVGLFSLTNPAQLVQWTILPSAHDTLEDEGKPILYKDIVPIVRYPNQEPTPPDPVPEPGTIVLVAAGVAALVSRKMFS